MNEPTLNLKPHRSTRRRLVVAAGAAVLGLGVVIPGAFALSGGSNDRPQVTSSSDDEPTTTTTSVVATALDAQATTTTTEVERDDDVRENEVENDDQGEDRETPVSAAT